MTNKITAILALIVLIACEPIDNSYCPEQVTAQAQNKLGQIYTLYANYLKLYQQYWSIGGKISSDEIQKINDVKLMAVNLKTPECLDKAKYYMIDSMTSVVGALYSVVAGDLPEVTKQLTEGSRLISLGDQELLKLRRCSPNCTREDMK